MRADGSFADFTTDLAVYQDGKELARKVIRVNDPLSVAGYTFHQNGFGPAPDLLIRDAKGRVLWDGPYALTDTVGGQPHGLFSVPGRDVGLEMLLTKAADGTSGILFLPYRAQGTQADGTPEPRLAGPVLRRHRRRSAGRPTPTSSSRSAASRAPRS